jgi:tetratricopeptide (TPR) repeat protein
MDDRRVHRSAERGTDAVAERFLRWTLPRRDSAELIFARQALDGRQFDEAERHLRRALDIDAESAQARSLMGVLHEGLGEHRAAYQCYKLALKIDRQDPIAIAGLQRYCERWGFDFRGPAINPALD